MVELPLRSLNAKPAMPGRIVASSRPSVYGCPSVRDPAIEQIVDHDTGALGPSEPEVGPLQPGEAAPPLVGDRREAAVRGVDVEPEPLPLTDVSDGGDGIHARRRGGADGGDDLVF